MSEYKYNFTFEPTETKGSRAKGIASRPEEKEEDNAPSFMDTFYESLSSFFSSTDEAKRVLSSKSDEGVDANTVYDEYEAGLSLKPEPVRTLEIVDDLGEQARRSSEEAALLRQESGIVKSLGPEEVINEETEVMSTIDSTSDSDSTSKDEQESAPVTAETSGAGLMSPPVGDDVEVDADTAEPVVEEEETATTTPTRDELIDSVFDAEGGYSTDVNDTGNYYRGQFVGTNHGISAPVLAEHLGRTPTVEDMRGLSQDTAREIAATQYYDTYNISDLPDDTQEIVFHAVYMGGSRGVRAVQNLTGATPDGVMGPNTRTAMQESTFTPQEFRDEYLRELELGTTGYSSPASTWDTHGRGWTNRYNNLAGN